MLGSVDDAGVQLVDQRREDRVRDVLRVFRVCRRGLAVPLVIQLGRDDHLVEERVADPGDLHPLLRAVRLLPDRDLLPVGRRPDADDVRARVDLADRDLQRDRVDAVAGEEVLAAAGRAGALAEAERVEDLPDVAEERVLTLACERGHPACERLDATCRERAVARRRPRPDVVRRSHARSDDLRPAAFDLRHRVRLRGRPQERDRSALLELEPVGDLGPAVAGPVEVDVVAGRRRELVVHRPGRRILRGDPVRDDRQHVRPVDAPERVQVGVVRRRILRDQRRLAVAGSCGGARLRPPGDGYGHSECCHSSRHCGELELVHFLLLPTRRGCRELHVLRWPGAIGSELPHLGLGSAR